MFKTHPHFTLINLLSITTLGLLILLAQVSLSAQEPFNKAEFATRRAKVFEKIGDGIVIVLANEPHQYAVKYRESPDFYYLTGIEEPNAILVMFGKTKRTVVFASRSSPLLEIDNAGLFYKKDAAEFYGISRVAPLDQFFYSYSFPLASKIYVPLTASDDLQFGRDEMSVEEAASLTHPLSPQMLRSKQAVQKLKEWQPHLTFHDINPILDNLRWVKSPYEIERLRKAGKIGAEGVKEAIKGTKAGMFEYELEAVARFIYTKRGARDAFMPIVPSGLNTMISHYSANNRLMKDGEVVLMDYGADYDYYVSDITRVWAVSGKFTPEQEKMYRCILEAHKAVIAMMKPGIKVSDMKNTAEKIYEKHGFGEFYRSSGRYIGHFVGISVHDVGEDEKPFVAGVVYNVEPTITNDALKTHLRLEDTILITPNGAENLTKDVPAEIDELYALQKMKALDPSK